MSTTWPGAALEESPKVVTRQVFAASVKAAEAQGARFNPSTVARCSSISHRVSVPLDAEEVGDFFAMASDLYEGLKGQEGQEENVAALYALKRKMGVALDALSKGVTYHAATPLGAEQRTKRAQARALRAEQARKPWAVRVGQ